MKKMSDKLFRNRKSLMLAIVAMLELLLLSVSLTFSWFDQATDPVVYGRDIPTAEAPLTDFLVGARDTRTVDLSNYFEMGSGMRFSPVFSADGKVFRSIENSSLILNASEINMSTLAFQFKVGFGDNGIESNAVGTCDFWIKNLVLNVDGVDVYSISGHGIQSSIPSEEVADEEPTTEGGAEEPTTESSDTEEATTEDLAEGMNPENTDVSESVDNSVPEEDERETKANHFGYENCLFVAFHVCGANGECTSDDCTGAITLAEAGSYLAGNSEGLSLFTHVATVGGEKTAVDCSIWYQPLQGISLPDGASVTIKLELTSSWSEKTIIYLKDATTMLSELYPQLDANSYNVELIHIASGEIYPAVYDYETDTWSVEVPLAVDEFNIRYRSKGVGRDVLASWSNINGEHVHGFTLMDEGVFIKSES